MATVTNTVKLPDGSTPGRVDVIIELVASTTSRAAGWVTANDNTILSVSRPTVTAGAWSATLTANDAIDPAGTVYKITEFADKHRYIHYIDVPSGGGTVHDLLVDAPASVESAALSVHVNTAHGEIAAAATGTAATDTANLQAALTAGAGGQVVFPAGDYVINAALEIPSYTHLVMLEGCEITLADGSNCDMITNSDWAAGNTRIRITGGYLDGNRTGQTSVVGDGPGQSAISLINCTDSVVEDTIITSAFLHGVDLGVQDESGNPGNDPGCRRCIVKNVRARDYGDDGVTTHYSSQIIITGCVFTDSAASYSGSSNGVEVDDGSHDVQVTGCLAINCSSGFMCQCHEGRVGAYNVSFSNCVAIDCDEGLRTTSSTNGSDGTTPGHSVSYTGGAFINCLSGYKMTHYSNVVIVGTVFYGCSRPWTSTSTVAGLTQRIRIANCAIDQTGSLFGCDMNTQIANVSHFTLEGCVIANVAATTVVSIGKDDCTVRGNSFLGNTGATSAVVWVVSGDRVTVENNRIEHSLASGYGVRIAGGTGVAVRNNQINITGSNAGVYIASGGSPSKLLVTGNTCIGGARGIYNLAAGGSGLITHNVCDSNTSAALTNSPSGGTWTVEKNLGVDI